MIKFLEATRQNMINYMHSFATEQTYLHSASTTMHREMVGLLLFDHMIDSQKIGSNYKPFRHQRRRSFPLAIAH